MKNTKITIIDDLHPEDNAMLQALQSRSPASVAERLEKVKAAGSGEFMSKFYVGYGHKSIGDCGTTTIFIENVTMLAAKAIQDWPLYSGQEASTRYMDFSEAEFWNPLGTAEGKEVQERWRAFYLEAQKPVREHLRRKYPRKDDEDEKVYERAINARSFDILRAFLPAGAMTNLSWQTNLRQAGDHLRWLMLHPDPHIGLLADQLYLDLSDRYSHSFTPIRAADDHPLKYRADVMDQYYFFNPSGATFQAYPPHVHVDATSTFLVSDAYEKLLRDRPPKTELPWFLSELGQVVSTFLLDFGSFRDLQRHRNGIVRMPLLTTQYGFHPWYLDELPTDLRVKAANLCSLQEATIRELPVTSVVAQNYIAMGYQVPCKVVQGLPGFVYRLELRSGKTVHPTLRQVVHEEIRQFRQLFPYVTLHVDEDPDSWTVRRGKQTIEEKD